MVVGTGIKLLEHVALTLMNVPIKEFVPKIRHVETFPVTILASVFPVLMVNSAQILMSVFGRIIATRTLYAQTVTEATSVPAQWGTSEMAKFVR